MSISLSNIIPSTQTGISSTFASPGNSRSSLPSTWLFARDLRVSHNITSLAEVLPKTLPEKGSLQEFSWNIIGSLDLSNCTRLTTLPANLFINHLNLAGCTSLTALPPNLSIGGGLNLADCTSLTALPEDLSILPGGTINCSNCTSLSSIPTKMHSYRGRVFLINTGLSQEILNILSHNPSFIFSLPKIEPKPLENIS